MSNWDYLIALTYVAGTIACGIYFEDSILLKGGTTLRSETGDPSCVTIDAQYRGSVLEGRFLDHLAVDLFGPLLTTEPAAGRHDEVEPDGST